MPLYYIVISDRNTNRKSQIKIGLHWFSNSKSLRFLINTNDFVFKMFYFFYFRIFWIGKKQKFRHASEIRSFLVFFVIGAILIGVISKKWLSLTSALHTSTNFRNALRDAAHMARQRAGCRSKKNKQLRKRRLTKVRRERT